MEREPVVGECLVVARDDGEHSLSPGVRLIVLKVDDSDSTILARVVGGSEVDDWIPWSDLEPLHFGWDFIRTHLPPDVVTILTAFEDIETVTLNKDVKRAIIATLPDITLRIREAIQSIEAGDDSH
jgi:hypothetical protein